MAGLEPEHIGGLSAITSVHASWAPLGIRARSGRWRFVPFVAIYRQQATGICVVHDPAQSELFHVAHALDPLRFLLGLGQGRQQHRRQNGNNRYYNKQFN